MARSHPLELYRNIGIMTRLFQADGRHVPVTVLQLEDVQVVARREMDKDGYTAVALGAGKAKAKNVAKPQRAAFGKAEVEPKARVVEFRVAEDALLDVGATISADHFVAGQMVDISGVTQGKGFAGAMKRAVQSALRLGAEGIRITCSGRLGGAEIARTEWYREGRVPLHTLRGNVDYAEAQAHTAYGVCGVKVWVFKGEILGHDPLAQDRLMMEAQTSGVRPAREDRR